MKKIVYAILLFFSLAAHSYDLQHLGTIDAKEYNDVWNPRARQVHDATWNYSHRLPSCLPDPPQHSLNCFKVVVPESSLGHVQKHHGPRLHVSVAGRWHSIHSRQQADLVGCLGDRPAE